MPVLSAEILNDPDENLTCLRTCVSGGDCPRVWEGRRASLAQSGSRPKVPGTAPRERLSFSMMCQRVTQTFGADGRDRLLAAERQAALDLNLCRRTDCVEALIECANAHCVMSTRKS
jgi:hypothetical protein